jgi:hypothetical protein
MFELFVMLGMFGCAMQHVRVLCTSAVQLMFDVHRRIRAMQRM